MIRIIEKKMEELNHVGASRKGLLNKYKSKWVKASSHDKLKRICELYGLIGLSIKQLHRELILKEFNESNFINEAWKDARFVQQKLNEINEFLSELDAIDLLFTQPDTYPQTHLEKQQRLRIAEASILVIRNSIMAIWAKRKVATNQADYQVITNLTIDAIETVSLSINDVAEYVKAYSDYSDRKLIFKTELRQFLRSIPKA